MKNYVDTLTDFGENENAPAPWRARSVAQIKYTELCEDKIYTIGFGARWKNEAQPNAGRGKDALREAQMLDHGISTDILCSKMENQEQHIELPGNLHTEKSLRDFLCVIIVTIQDAVIHPIFFLRQTMKISRTLFAKEDLIEAKKEVKKTPVLN